MTNQAAKKSISNFSHLLHSQANRDCAEVGHEIAIRPKAKSGHSTKSDRRLNVPKLILLLLFSVEGEIAIFENKLFFPAFRRKHFIRRNQVEKSAILSCAKSRIRELHSARRFLSQTLFCSSVRLNRFRVFCVWDG